MAGSEELERSLRAEIEQHINTRLSGQQAEIMRVQNELNGALTRLAEQLTNSDETPDAALVVAVSEHLRRAHGQGAEEAAQQSARARAASDMALLKAAVDELDNQSSQADILNALVNRAASFAPRVAFFVVKNEHVTGWRARGLEGTVGDDGVREISLPLAEQTVLSEVAQTRAAWSGAPGAYAADHELLQKLGGEPPQRMVAIPLIARERAVAVLYADSAALEPDAVNLEALETLVRVTGMAVELLAGKRTAPRAAQTASPMPAQAASPATTATVPAVESQPAAASEEPPDQPERAIGEPAWPRTSVQFARPQPAAEVEEPAAPPAESAWSMPSVEPEVEVAPALDTPAETTTPPTAEPEYAAPEYAATTAPAPPTEERGIAPFGTSAPEPAAPGDTTATPLGGGRRYGMDAALPIEVEEDERRFHNDARRFARLLVSEIKLYNEQKVRDGREHGDLYERLRDEIDRSRQMYDKRADPRVTGRYDYFHHELVGTLAEGDADKLGREYPGAQVAA